MAKDKQGENGKGRPVVVCTELKGVFFGYTEDSQTATVVSLKSARNALYWNCEGGGILQLGSTGPGKGSKIGDRADLTLQKVSAVIECTPEAAARWEAAGWGK